ncbi:MAG: CpsD/CapB family tyrosine-protein kinase [Hyphomicrobium sp.]|uniref:CpsD/CapB family tyrosine-protein kinase n=1 Tax=Hyphomicrobium sp. TaxID=82 RepID=UPI0039E4FEF8
MHPIELAGTGPREANTFFEQAPQSPPLLQFDEVQLNERTLEAARIIAQNSADPRATAYDMLRTQILQSLDAENRRLLVVTSPTMGCGKTVTSLNLALSIARQKQRPVFLVDMDFRKPQLAKRLGIDFAVGLSDVLSGRASLDEAILKLRVGPYETLFLPTRAADGSSELISSRPMKAFIQSLRTIFQSHLVILDMPPMLVSDDVIGILPHTDSVLLITAAGASTIPEVEECMRHLHSSNLVRIVVNKVPKSKKRYY